LIVFFSVLLHDFLYLGQRRSYGAALCINALQLDRDILEGGGGITKVTQCLMNTDDESLLKLVSALYVML
jgi:hypothetical protein